MATPTLALSVAAGVGVALVVALLLAPPAGRRERSSRGARRAAPAPATAAPTPGGARRGLSDRLARSAAARRVVGGLAVVLVLAAGVSASWPFWTDQYQSRLQVRLERQLDTPEIAEAYSTRRAEEGDSLTRLRAPAIGVDVVVVAGTTQSALRAGAGHYPETALPCGAGNVAIAGHRTTFGAPFAQLDEMGPGDEITLETPLGTCRYRVAEAPFVVTPEEVGVVTPTETPRLTLTTCHPKGSARERLVLQADLVGHPLHDDRGGGTPPDIRGET